METYDVAVYLPVVARVCNVQAETPEDACRKAAEIAENRLATLDLGEWVTGVAYIEASEDAGQPEYLVDQVRDGEDPWDLAALDPDGGVFYRHAADGTIEPKPTPAT